MTKDFSAWPFIGPRPTSRADWVRIAEALKDAPAGSLAATAGELAARYAQEAA